MIRLYYHESTIWSFRRGDTYFMRNMELLAPAGNMSALHAAVRAGAGAVYLGLESFNARRGADNFTIAMLDTELH